MSIQADLNKAVSKDKQLSEKHSELTDKHALLERNLGELMDEIGDVENLISISKRHEALMAERDEKLPSLYSAIEALRAKSAHIKTNTINSIGEVLAKEFASTASWDDIGWKNWSPDASEISLPKFLRLGESNGVPVGIPFMGQKGNHGAILILASEEKTELAKNMLAGLVLRLALSLPKISKFSLIDPEHHGRTFRMQADLTDVRKIDGTLESDLQMISNDVRRVATSVLGYEDSFEHLSPDIWAAERFEGVFVADFGSHKTTTQRVFESLLDIANGGRPAGRFLFMHVNTSTQLPKGIDLSKFKNAEIIDLNDESDSIQFDDLPDGKTQSRLLNVVRNQKMPEKREKFEELIGVNVSSCWKESSKDRIETSVGNNLTVWFGSGEEGRNCAHAALAGSTGSGKSIFMHVLISGLALRYSPNELRMYLVDGKSGVGFKRYEKLPHADVVSLKTSPLLALSVIRDLLSEMESRYHVFNKCAVEHIAQYREKFPEKLMPRILLVADEYQNLFESDPEEATRIIDVLTAKGRAAGIHLLLASQKFVVAGMGRSGNIFNNIAMRISLQQADVGALADFFGPEGRKMIKELNRPGMVVLNDSMGNDSENRRGMVAMMTEQEVEQLNLNLSEKASSSDELKFGVAPIVFHGNDTPRFVDSVAINKLTSSEYWLSVTEIENMARQSGREGGFNIRKWNSSQKPIGLMLGRLFEVYGDAFISLQRSESEHLLVVGDNASHMGEFLSSQFVSMASIHAPDQIEFRSYSFAPHDLSGNGGIESITNELLGTLGYSVDASSQLPHSIEAIHSIASLVESRKSARDPSVQTSIVVLIRGLVGVDALPESSSAEVKASIKDILRYGSQVGVHLVVHVSSLQQIGYLIEERDMNRFNHRITWQISEDDSRRLMGSSIASKLNTMADGEVAMHQNRTQRETCFFRPYFITEESICEMRTKLSARIK